MWCLLVASMALAQPHITLHATVADDLKTIHGTLVVDPPAVDYQDLLSTLPEPPDDLTSSRTYPRRPNQGQLVWTEEDGVVTFTASLPERFGDVGATRHSLHANGVWYPEPVIEDEGPIKTWSVTLNVPGDAVGAVGDQAATSRITWEGTGDRAPIAVIRDGVLTPLETPQGPVTLLTRHPPRRPLQRELLSQLDAVWPEGTSLQGVVVEAPLRRRLTRSSPGLLYISDRAYRVTPGLYRYHHVAVTRGLLESWLPIASRLERHFVAGALTAERANNIRRQDAEGLLRKFQWLPRVNSLLASQRTPFYADLMERPIPSDPLRDDVADRTGSNRTGAQVIAQLNDLYGPEVPLCVATKHLAGTPWPDACEMCGMDVEVANDAWAPTGPQDYRLLLRERENTMSATIERTAAAESPPEIVVVQADQTRHVARLAPNERWTVNLGEDVKRVVLDPERHLEQTDRVRDSWPRRLQISAAGGISMLNLSSGDVIAGAWSTSRWQWDTRRLWIGTLVSNRTTLVGGHINYLHKFGPTLVGWIRPHRLRFGVGSSLLKAAFSEQDALTPTVEASTAYTWDPQVVTEFPRKGQRAAWRVGVGFVPSSGNRWVESSVMYTQYLPFHPRHVLAVELSGAMVDSEVPHRALTLGGPGTVLGIPALPACTESVTTDCSTLADRRAMTRLEYRWEALRNLHLPMGLAWGTSIQVSAGLDAALARTDRGGAWVTGYTVGLAGVGDVLGVEPMLVGLSAGWPLAQHNVPEAESRGGPQLMLRWAQRF